MYSISGDSNGRLGDRSGDSKLPVLFHLIDVSRPRAPIATEVPAPAAVQPTVALVDQPLIDQPQIDLPPPSLAEPPPLEIPVATTSASSSEALAGSPTTIEPSSMTVDSNSDAPKTDSAPVEQTALPEPEQPLAAPIATTTRAQVNSRRRAKTSASEDWFASHGKYIAVAFVLALVGTIYFARTNRQQATTAKNSAKGEVVVQNERSTAAAAIGEQTGVKVSNLVTTVAATAEPKVDLHPPVASSSTAVADKTQTKDDLFTFQSPKAADERVAARPESSPEAGNQPASTPQVNTAPPLATAPASAPAAPAAPLLGPAYPTTSAAPPAAYPTAPTPYNSYPQTPAPPRVPAAAPQISYPVAPQAPAGPTYDYRSQYQPAAAPMQPQQQWAAPAPGTGLPGQYQPLDNTALGPRYERTGSGNY